MAKSAYQNVCCAFDNKAVCETVQANSSTLLIKVNLLFRQKMTYSTACTKTWKKTTKKKEINLCQSAHVK